MQNPLADDLDHILSYTRNLWDELRGRRLFLTGGTGFLGCWLLESFLWVNEKLNLNSTALVLTRSPENFRKKAPHLASHPAIQFHRGNVRSFQFPEGEFSHVIHAATEASAQLIGEQPVLRFETVVKGTWQTLEFARSCGARKFLLTSSGAVYGKQPPGLSNVPEDFSGAPDCTQFRSAYGEGKRVAELLCTLYAKEYGLANKIARCYAFVGPYLPLDIHFAIGNFIRDGLQGVPIRVKGDGTPYRSYLYAADLMIWLWTILFRGETCRPYNVGSSEAITIADLAHQVARAFEPSMAVKIAQPPMPGQPAERYVPDTRRAETELNLRCSFSLRESIARTIQWHREHLR